MQRSTDLGSNLVCNAMKYIGVANSTISLLSIILNEMRIFIEWTEVSEKYQMAYRNLDKQMVSQNFL